MSKRCGSDEWSSWPDPITYRAELVCAGGENEFVSPHSLFSLANQTKHEKMLLSGNYNEEVPAPEGIIDKGADTK